MVGVCLVGWRAALVWDSEIISSLLACRVCGSSGERRAGAWEFRNHCICIRLRQRAIA